jgi:hypothetical protein
MDAHFLFIPPRRGWFKIKELRLYTRFPFGLLRKWWTLAHGDEERENGMFITPKLFEVDPTSIRSTSLGGEHEASAHLRGEGTTLYGLREYRESDNPKRIHWKASAKRSALESDISSWFVREMETEEKKDILLWWPDLNDFSIMKNDEAEAFLGYFASLLKTFEREGHNTKVFVPCEMDGREQRLYQILDPWEYVSIFDPARPMEWSSMSYLEFVPTGIFSGFGSEIIDVFENYRRLKRAGAQ